MAGRPAPPARRACASSWSSSSGAPLTRLPSGVIPKPVLTASRGEFSNILTEAVPNNVPGHWRTQFDLTVTGTDPVEMRCYLRNGERGPERDLALSVPSAVLR